MSDSVRTDGCSIPHVSPECQDRLVLTVQRLALAGLVLAVLALPGAAPAAYPGANGPVAFVSGQHIWIQTGAGLKDLTGAGGNETQPKFSPDGRRIAFVKGGSGLPNTEIFVMNADGSGKTALTKTPTGNSDPTWSPDGTRLAFVSLRDKGVAQIYLMNADGTGVREITHDTTGKSELAWSPKGDRIAFTHVPAGGGDREIYSIKTDGTGAVDLTNDPTHPDMQAAWSPDGTRLAYGGPIHPGESVGGDLWTMNADGSNQQPLHHQSTYSDGGYPAWSPDGTTIAFGANNGSGYYHLWSVPAGGGQNTELVANKIPGGNPVDQQTDWGTLPHGPVAAPAPVAGRSAAAAVVSGTVLIQVPGGKFVPLTAAQSIPVGSLVDTTKGVVALTAAASGKGRTQKGTFAGGVFKFTQKARRTRVLRTDLTLRGGSFGACATRSLRDVEGETARRRAVRYLAAKAHGKFSVVGKYSTGLERGTTWTTTDRCDGTLTAVAQGSVKVTDRVRHKTVIVRAGHSYLARARHS
jgi:hypothetical protein